MAPDGTSEEPAARYPTLSDWLTGAPPDHPWLPFFESSAPEMAALALPLERILAELVRAAPSRLASKRKEFRQDTAGVLNLRAELNVGHTLARSGAEFAFGAEGQPDYQCRTAGGPVWVEVTTRARDDLSKLHDEIELSLRGQSVVVTLRLPRLVAIPEQRRKTVCAQIREAFDAMTAPDSSVGLPGIDGQAWLTTPSLFGGAHVVLDIGSDLTSHGEAVEKAAVDTIAVKVEQSIRGSWPDDTVLVMDLSRLGMSWLRPDSVWGGRLEAMPLVWERIPLWGHRRRLQRPDPSGVPRSPSHAARSLERSNPPGQRGPWVPWVLAGAESTCRDDAQPVGNDRHSVPGERCPSNCPTMERDLI